MKPAAAAVALLCLAACLASSVLFFYDVLASGVFKTIFLVASIGWFAAATFWASRAEGTAEEVISQ
jgi:type III secretory pathway component EscT